MAQVRDTVPAATAGRELSRRSQGLARTARGGGPRARTADHRRASSPWDRPNWRYLLDDLLEDTRSGHNVLGTVFIEAHAFHKADGPDEMKAVGEVEFVNGICAMTASGHSGKTRVAGHRRHRGPRARQPR